MTNPNNAVGTNAAYGGRTSVNAFNDWANFYSRGIVSGWIGAPSSGMTIQFGGLAGVRDVALAEDPNGNKTTINNTTTSPVPVTVAAASTTSNRQDVVVAYVNSPAEVSTTTVDNPGACGIIAVPGSASSAPNDSAIRAAITSDGGTGTTAYYVILAVVAVSANTTTITSEMILQNGFYAQVAPANILPSQSISSDKIDFATFANAPIETKTVGGPYGLSINLLRTLNLVFYTIFDNPNGIPGSGTSAETIPVGFRPTQDITTVARQDTGETGRWTVQTDGKANWFLPAAGNANVTVCLSFPTSDPWPTN